MINLRSFALSEMSNHGTRVFGTFLSFAADTAATVASSNSRTIGDVGPFRHDGEVSTNASTGVSSGDIEMGPIRFAAPQYTLP